MNNQISRCYQKADKVEDLYNSGHISKAEFLSFMKQIKKEIDFIMSHNIESTSATSYFN